MKISVCVITLNEEANLGRCLKSCADLADEIVVLDSGSTDATESIANRFQARWHQQDWLGYVGQKNCLLALATRTLALQALPGKRSDKRFFDFVFAGMELVKDSSVFISVATVDIELNGAVSVGVAFSQWTTSITLRFIQYPKRDLIGMLEVKMTRLRINLEAPRSRRFGNSLDRFGVGLLLSMGLMCGCGEKGGSPEAPVAASPAALPREDAPAHEPAESNQMALAETEPASAPIQTTDSNEGLNKAEPNPPKRSFELYDIGVRLLKGEGVEKNVREAERLFRESAQLGNPLAEHNLGVMYLTGIGVEKDTATAVEWIRKAGERGLAEAQFKLAGFYATGLGVPENVEESAVWLRKAAEQGHVEAAYNLATFYAGEKNEKSNFVEAAKWYRIAAEHGKVSAQSNLGVLYGRGLGVTQDFAEAVKWFRKAAERGHRSAQFNLGRSYIDGKALESDKVEAYKWYSLSAAQGDPDAERERLELSIEMSSREMGEAIRRANEFTTRMEAERTNAGGLIQEALRE